MTNGSWRLELGGVNHSDPGSVVSLVDACHTFCRRESSPASGGRASKRGEPAWLRREAGRERQPSYEQDRDGAAPHCFGRSISCSGLLKEQRLRPNNPNRISGEHVSRVVTATRK